MILIVSDLWLREKATFKVLFLCETWPWSRSVNLQALFFMVPSSSYEHLEADAQHCHYASYAVKPWYCETVNYVFTVCKEVKHSRGLPRFLDSTRTQRLWHGEKDTTESALEETTEYKKELFSKKKLEVENGIEVVKFIHELSFVGTKLSFFFSSLGFTMVTMCFYKSYL